MTITMVGTGAILEPVCSSADRFEVIVLSNTIKFYGITNPHFTGVIKKVYTLANPNSTYGTNLRS